MAKVALYAERAKRGVSIGKAARSLGVSVFALRDWMNLGKVPGVFRTQGGHRRVTRDALLKFAGERGLTRFSDDRRAHPRILARKLKVQLGVPGHAVRGEGRLRDLSASGFRVDRIKWKTPIAPVLGTEFTFLLPVGKKLGGVSGMARVAWHRDDRKERGATLGGRIDCFGSARARRSWTSYLASKLN